MEKMIDPRNARRPRAAGLLIAAALAAPAAAFGDPRVLAAYFGDSVLANQARLLCPPPTTAAGFGGMPIVFRSQIDAGAGFAGNPLSLDPAHFRVRVRGTPGWTTPLCATLLPAVDPTEQRTVLLTGEFGSGGFERPVAIRIVGDVLTTDGASLKGLITFDVAGTDTGPELVLAERFTPGDGLIATSSPDDGTQDAFCPTDGTAAVVKLTFSGGVSGPNDAPLQDDPVAMAAIQAVATGPSGRRFVLNPFALRDVDNDNHLDACFAPFGNLELRQVAVDSGVFFGPQNGANRSAAVPIE
jgi:hypothetical protein